MVVLLLGNEIIKKYLKHANEKHHYKNQEARDNAFIRSTRIMINAVRKKRQ